MRRVGEIVGDTRAITARARGPIRASTASADGHVGDDRDVLAEMPAQPRQVALQRRRPAPPAGTPLAEPRDRQVALDAAARVQHLGIDQPPRRHVDVVGAEPLQQPAALPPLDPDLAEARHVEQPDALRSAMCSARWNWRTSSAAPSRSGTRAPGPAARTSWPAPSPRARRTPRPRASSAPCSGERRTPRALANWRYGKWSA